MIMASQHDKSKNEHEDMAPAAKPKESSSKSGSWEFSVKSKRKSENSSKASNELLQNDELWCMENKCDDCWRERHFNREVNGHHHAAPSWPARELGIPSRAQLCNISSLFSEVPASTSSGGGDDMENYFNANVGLLQDDVNGTASGDCDEPKSEWPNGDIGAHSCNVDEDWVIGERKSQMLADEGVEMVTAEDHDGHDLDSMPQVYLSEEYLRTGSSYRRCDSNDSLYNHCEDEVYQTNIGNSMEDLGDFIETDMPKNPFGCGSSDSNSSHSRTPSDDGLSALALGPGKPVTGAGDIHGALSLDWGMHLNIESAQKPPTLLEMGRPSTLSSDSSTNKPRTGSDTDYGFFTPTSCASGSSLRTRSVQSPPLSDSSATCGLASAESSAFASPEMEQPSLPTALAADHPRNPAQNSAPMSNHTPVSGEAQGWQFLQKCRKSHHVRPRPHSDGHVYVQQFPTDLEMDNLDTASEKSSKDKHIDVQLCNKEVKCFDCSSDRRKSKKHCSSASSSHYEHSHSSLPQLAAKSTPADRNDLLLGPFEHNNLSPVRYGSAEEHVSHLSDQFNVSRQTSTSDFDQDENSFQEFVELPPGDPCSFRSACDHDVRDTDNGIDADDEDLAFQDDARHSPLYSCRRSSSLCNKLHVRRQPTPLPPRECRLQPNVVGSTDPGCDHDGGNVLINLLQRIQVVEISPEETGASSGANLDDIPLPPQTPIPNRQWLKKAAKLLGHNFPGGPVSEVQSESDSDDQDMSSSNNAGGSDVSTEVTPSDSSHSLDHLSSREKLYSVLLKDALLKHLQETNEHYQSKESGGEQNIKKVMLWTEYQAYVLQVSQIGTSACGATAVINVLKSFDMYIEREKVCEAIRTNLRAETATVSKYLLSRSVAGTTAEDLISGITELTNGTIVGRFFALYPERDISILKWLGEWMEKGAVPVVTLNRQRAVPQGWVIPDAWHHQMVYGVGPKGVYLTNPLEIVPEYVIQNQLCSESVLLIRRKDVVSRWRRDCNLGLLLEQEDVRWQEMNVLGQVVNVLREDKALQFGTQLPILTSHITIPAWYKSGVTLFVQRDSEVHCQLMAMPDELPLRVDDKMDSISSNGSSMQQLFAEPAT